MPFVPKRTKETFSFVQLIGFLLLIFGSLIFNEVIEIPYYGFNEYTKRALALKEKRIEEINKEEDNLIKEENNY